MSSSFATNKTLLFGWLLTIAACLQIARAQLSARPDSVMLRKPADTTSGATVISNKSATQPAKNRFDSTFSPRKATIRSAIFPGLGQIYNRQIWKLPLVYGAIGTTAGIFVFNVKEYRALRQAYIYKVDTITANDSLIPTRFSVLSANSLKFYRDQYRRNVDYSVLAFLIAWGLNVVDATVSAHLRQFDVGDDLTLKIKPTLLPTGTVGIGLVMNF